MDWAGDLYGNVVRVRFLHRLRDERKFASMEELKAQIENDLQVELDAVKRLNAGIETCVNAGDNGSRELLEGILTDEEEHIDWLEAQLHAIGEMGIENYLAQQLHEKEG